MSFLEFAQWFFTFPHGLLLSFVTGMFCGIAIVGIV